MQAISRLHTHLLSQFRYTLPSSRLVSLVRHAEVRRDGNLRLRWYSGIVPISSAQLEDDKIKVQWQNGYHSEFHNIWLRDHCNCPKCYNQTTNQRELDLLQVPLEIKPRKVTTSDNMLELKWPDDHVTVFSSVWLMKHGYGKNTQSKVDSWVQPKLWNKSQIASVELPKITYKSVVEDDKECFRVSFLIEQYGFAFVHDMPTDLSCLEKLANALGGFVRETNYGRLWDFSNEVMDHADTAYTAQALQAHTDSAYFTDPAGLQLLHCTFHNGKGGENLLVDGFHAADVLKKRDLEAFKYLSSQMIPFHFKDGVIHFKATGHVIELDPFTNEVARIRFNLYDRDILDCLPAEDIPKFYHAIRAFASVIQNPGNEFWFKLVPGVCLVMANWRVLHGRSGFTGLRKMQGCYINRDDFRSHSRAKYKIYKNELDKIFFNITDYPRIKTNSHSIPLVQGSQIRGPLRK